jgi:simple sugar transport system permease protein
VLTGRHTAAAEDAQVTADFAVAFLAAIIGGALRVGVPFLFVSLGECLTEKSGRINLGLEGVLVLSAMAGFGGAYLTGSPWAGVMLAALAGAALALLHGLLCSLPRVNDVATGIALMLLGTGLAFYLGKPLIQPQAPQLPPIALGGWSGSQVVQAGAAGQSAAAARHRARDGDALGLRAHALGPAGAPRRRFGERDQGARLFGQRRPHRRDDRRRRDRRPRRRLADLVLPGSWNEGISSGQGLIAVALVIFARWSPWRCVGAALLFGGAGAIGPALQSIGISQGYYLFGAVPYVLTVVILVISCRPGSVARGSPGELSSVR